MYDRQEFAHVVRPPPQRPDAKHLLPRPGVHAAVFEVARVPAAGGVYCEALLDGLPDGGRLGMHHPFEHHAVRGVRGAVCLVALPVGLFGGRACLEGFVFRARVSFHLLLARGPIVVDAGVHALPYDVIFPFSVRFHYHFCYILVLLSIKSDSRGLSGDTIFDFLSTRGQRVWHTLLLLVAKRSKILLAPFACCPQKVKIASLLFACCTQKVKVYITAVCFLCTKSQSVYHCRLLVVDKKSKIVLLSFACCTQKVKDGRPGKEALCPFYGNFTCLAYENPPAKIGNISFLATFAEIQNNKQ